MCFNIEEGKTDCKTIKVSFTNKSPSEHTHTSLIQLLEDILAMQECFEWFVKCGVNGDDADKTHLLAF